MTNIPKELILKQMELGPLANFLYFIGDAKTKEIAVVDPAWNVDHLCEQAKKNGYTIKAVFLTHGKSDILWRLIPPLAYLQFPWRFLAPAVFFLSLKYILNKIVRASNFLIQLKL